MSLYMRLKNIFGARRRDSEMHDQFVFHLEAEIGKNIASGMTAEEARRQALIAFGGVQQTREAVHEVTLGGWLHSWAQDVRFGVRILRKSPGFTLVAILMLAVGIGGNTAIFSVVNAVLLRPLPYPNAKRLVEIRETYGKGVGTVSPPNFRDWSEQAMSFEQLVAFTGGSKNLQDISAPERVKFISATANLFQALGVQAARGRVFVPADQDPSKPPVAVISAGLWKRRFGADPRMVGTAITLDGEPYTVVGIMPDEFRFPAIGQDRTDVWLPLRLSPKEAQQRGNHWLFVLGLVKHGTRSEQAAADLKTVAARLAGRYPEDQGRSTLLLPLQEASVGAVRPELLSLLGAIGFVLLIACANLANLLLARAQIRRREIAVRIALGASRARVIRQLFTETLLLAISGGIAGAALAFLGVKGLVALAKNQIPRLMETAFDLRVFLFLVLLSLLSALLFGLAPAFESARVEFTQQLKASFAGFGTRQLTMKFRNGLIVAEVALTMVLLTAAGLLMKTFYLLSNTDPGFRTDHILTLHLNVPEKKYPSQAVADHFYQPLLEKVSALPGVQSAGMISMLPIQEAWSNSTVQVEGRPPVPQGQETWAEIRAVSPGYFSTMGISLRKGRNISEDDHAGNLRVLLINEELARECFPHEDPLGKRLLFPDPWTIVGVVSNVKQAGLDIRSLPEVYFPYLQVPELLHGSMVLVTHASVPPETMVSELRTAIRSIDPEQPIYDVETMGAVVAESISDRRLYMGLMAIFAVIALVLALTGIYGVISFLIAQRTNEFGIRLALGAHPRQLLASVLRQGLRMVAVGIVFGIAGSLAVTRVLESYLYGVKPTDSTTYIVSALVLALIAVAATYIPARKVTRVDPLIALRYE